jgi:ABC-type Fe3+/spermidine/putrescine transport system ATPase subunit
LLDEPLSNLDAKLREQMRGEIRALQKQLGLTILYVTHDQAEAMTLSDRLAVVNHGRFEQVGAPDMVYEKPASTFVANFLGRMVSFSGRVVSDGTLRRFEFAENAGHATCAEPFAPSENGAAELLTRPEDIEVLEAGALGDGQLNGVVEQVAYLGECFEYQVHTAGISVSITAPKRRRFEVGAAVRLALDPARVTVKTQ